jgi:plasmid stability protein
MHRRAIIDSIVAQLIVRNLDDALVRALKRRAAKAGRSAEAEHREILRAALAADVAKQSFKRLIAEMPHVGRDRDFAPARDLPRKPTL